MRCNGSHLPMLLLNQRSLEQARESRQTLTRLCIPFDGPTRTGPVECRMQNPSPELLRSSVEIPRTTTRCVNCSSQPRASRSVYSVGSILTIRPQPAFGRIEGGD